MIRPRLPILVGSGVFGLAWLFVEGFAIGLHGWNFAFLESLFGPVDGQTGLGYGALAAGNRPPLFLCDRA